MAGDVTAVLDALDPASAHVVGLSMGGVIAQTFAIHNPARVRSLLLLSTYGRADEWFNRLMRARRRMVELTGVAEQLELAMCIVFSPESFIRNRALVATAEERIRASLPDKAAYLRQVDFCLAHDALNRLSEVTCPTLVVTGALDVLTPPHLGRELAEALPTASYREVVGASHALWLEQPELIAELAITLAAESEQQTDA